MITFGVVVALMLVGAVLLVVELAVVPGVGVAGVAAALFLLGGVTLAWTHWGPAWGVGALLTAAAGAGAVVVIAPRTRAGKSLVLDAQIGDRHTDDRDELVGKTGVAATPLRPSGAAEIAGRRVDVVTRGELIDAGTRVRVAHVEGARVVVERDSTL